MTLSLTGGDEAGCFVGDGTIPALIGDVGHAAVVGISGVLLAARPTALATLFKTTNMSNLHILFGGFDAGDAARAGTH